MYSSRAVKLADFIRTLPDLNLQPPERRPYAHMGATLTDAVLQSGLNYRTVVYPRVRSVMERFPSATSTASFWTVLETHTPATVLNWSHPENSGDSSNLLVCYSIAEYRRRATFAVGYWRTETQNFS